jgi:phosphoribosylaminoimidazole-succinocarboxamide synthase
MSLSKEGLEKLYTGKTKDVYRYGEGKILLYAKDAVTGWKVKNADGTVSVVEDPGANEVIGEVEGIGIKNIKSSIYYFELFKNAGLETHYIDSDLEAKTMLVHEAKPIGHGLECIVRFKAMGSILRAYPDYLTEGQPLHDFFEVTTKNDAAGDPRISKELLCSPDFGTAMTEEQYEQCKELCLKSAKLIQDDLAKIGLTLIDLKFEIGKIDNKVVLIDEISAGIMRVYNGDKKLSEEELADIMADRKRA